MDEPAERVQHAAELSKLTVWRIFPWNAPKRVVIDADAELAEQARSWERQLSRLQSSCGCEQGAAGLMVGAVGYLLFLLLRPGGWGHPGRREFWIGFGVLVVTTSAGKFLGLLRAQRRLRRVIGEIQRHWVARPALHHSTTTAINPITSQVGQKRCCGERSTKSILLPHSRS